MKQSTIAPIPGEGLSSKSIGDPTTYEFSSALVALERLENIQAEGFRALRTHIMARHVEEGRRSLAICAATNAVGCTFVAANLAVALSQIGVNTLLIDGNLRSPSVDQMFRPSTPIVGLQQCLETSAASVADFIQHLVLPNLSILFAGGMPHNPQELLATDRFSEMMSTCLRDYDLTIVDTAPANSCSDAHRVSTVAGYSLVVAGRDRTIVSDVRTLVSQLESDRARVIGSVMTES